MRYYLSMRMAIVEKVSLRRPVAKKATYPMLVKTSLLAISGADETRIGTISGVGQFSNGFEEFWHYVQVVS
jgi:hypothetical protein